MKLNILLISLLGFIVGGTFGDGDYSGSLLRGVVRGAARRALGRGKVLTKPRIRGSLEAVGPFGGAIGGVINGGVRETYDGGLRGRLDSGGYVKAPLGGGFAGGRRSLSGSYKPGLGGRLDGR